MGEGKIEICGWSSSLEVQWLGLRTSTAGGQVPSLVRELRFSNMTKKKKKDLWVVLKSEWSEDHRAVKAGASSFYFLVTVICISTDGFS